jgi:hypothetical protein
MALTFVDPSPLVLQTYQESLLDFLGPHPPIAQLYHLPVGTLGLAELAGGATLKDVASSGCRILAFWPEATWTSCEMTNPSFYGNALFRNFIAGEAVEAVFQRIDQAQALDPVQSAQYELHFLSIPAIYLEALRLVCEGERSDIVLPLLSIDRRLGPDAALDEGAFLAIAHAVAAARVGLTSTDPLSS